MPDDKKLEERIEEVKKMLKTFSNFKFDKQVSDYAKQKLDFINKIIELKEKADHYHKENKQIEKLETEADIIKLLAKIKKIKEISFNMEDIKNNKDIYDTLDLNKKFDEWRKKIGDFINKCFDDASFEDKMKFVFGYRFYDYKPKDNKNKNRSADKKNEAKIKDDTPCSKYIKFNSESISKLNKQVNEVNDIDFYMRVLEYKNKYGHENEIIAAIEISDENKRKFDFDTNKKRYKKRLGLGITLCLLGSILVVPVVPLIAGGVFLAIDTIIFLGCLLIYTPLPNIFFTFLGIGARFIVDPLFVMGLGYAGILFMALVPLIGVALLKFSVEKIIKPSKLEMKKINLFCDQYQQSKIKTQREANKFIEENVLGKEINFKDVNENKLNKTFYMGKNTGSEIKTNNIKSNDVTKEKFFVEDKKSDNKTSGFDLIKDKSRNKNIGNEVVCDKNIDGNKIFDKPKNETKNDGGKLEKDK